MISTQTQRRKKSFGKKQVGDHLLMLERAVGVLPVLGMPS